MRKVLPLLILVVGCRNECQELCLDMAALADECGQSWSEEQVDSCLEEYSTRNQEKTDLEVCEAERPYLQDEWNCDWLEEYFD